jgi:hypothetical protein
VLDMLDELDQWGLSPPVLVADAGYGEVAEFHQGLDDRAIGYVCCATASLVMGAAVPLVMRAGRPAGWRWAWS